MWNCRGYVEDRPLRGRCPRRKATRKACPTLSAHATTPSACCSAVQSSELPEPRLDVAAHRLEARGDEETLLVVRRVVAGVGHALDVPCLESFLGLEPSQLTERGEKAGAVDLEPAFLAEHAEFQCVPVEAADPLDVRR